VSYDSNLALCQPLFKLQNTHFNIKTKLKNKGLDNIHNIIFWKMVTLNINYTNP